MLGDGRPLSGYSVKVRHGSIGSRMSELKPFLPVQARDTLTIEGTGDSILPICMPASAVMMGEALAVLVLTLIEDQRVGIPMGHQTLSYLHQAIGEALRQMQAPGGGSAQ